MLQGYPTDGGVEDTTVGAKNLDERVEERQIKTIIAASF